MARRDSRRGYRIPDRGSIGRTEPLNPDRVRIPRDRRSPEERQQQARERKLLRLKLVSRPNRIRIK